MPNPLEGLNPQQQDAVEHLDGPLCVFAGPGSGKTHTLIRRIACLIWLDVDPSQIMAITFTRKAADELKRRLRNLVGKDVYADTFHAFCFRTLRRYFSRIGGDNNFRIADEDDQQKIIKNLPAANNNPDARPSDIKLEIQNYKLDPNALRPDLADPAWLRDWYRPYQAELDKRNMLDFSDLLRETVRLFKECPDLLNKARDRYHYTHVDEYQDTNYLQGELAHMLAGPRGNICVVGDDDQSIYGFHGACPDNIRKFTEEQYPGARTITLEQNYRSTKTIVKASLAVIKNNVDRRPKKLFAKNKKGSLIKIIHSRDEKIEAQEIARTIRNLQREEPDLEYRDIAILYRSRWIDGNQRIEEDLKAELTSNGIPFNMRRSGALDRRALLEDDLNYVVPDRDEVALSTVHGAKGLEYKVVFMIGLEQGIFPDRRNCLEEERRLFYVGMTRAKKLLYLSYAKRRNNRYRICAPFLKEIPPSLTR